MNTKHVLLFGWFMTWWLTGLLSGLAVSADSPLPIQQIKDVAYTVPTSPDETAQQLDIYAPKEPGPWPVLVFLHGLGERKWEWWHVGETLAAQGMVVIIPNWWVLDPYANISGVMKAVRDMTCAMRFARGKAAEYGGDPKRVTLMGFLAGVCGKVVAFGGEVPFRALAGNDELGTCVVYEAAASPEAFISIAGPICSFKDIIRN
jgi:dienelactone hydrolase